MKKLMYFVIITLTTLYISSCTEDLKTNSTNISQNEVLSDFEIIGMLGLSVYGIVEQENHYVVEGDIVIEKSDIDSIRLAPKTRQALHSRITGGREESIRVKISSNNLPDPEWREAARQAVDIWNTVPNCRVHFYKIEQQILYHDVKVNMGSITSVAFANFPSNGKPGKEVMIDSTIDWYNDTLEEKIYILVHEFGHILGLGHTDYIANYIATNVASDNPVDNYHISGTPLTEDASVMDSHSAGRDAGAISTWTGFTAGDIFAIQSMYGTPDYSVAIVGPDALLPGETETYYLESVALLQGYTADFQTTWAITAPEVEIVNQTNVSVTVRSNSERLLPINVSASINYNGRVMAASFAVNDPAVSCYRSLYDQTISGTTTLAGCGVWASNVTVQSGVALTLQAPVIVIDEPFTVEAGATLVLEN